MELTLSNTRAERRREAREKNKQKIDTHLKRHLGENPSGLPRVPKTKKEMQVHLGGKKPEIFREPNNRAEKRAWDKWWKLKGKGYTKSVKAKRKRASSFSKRRRLNDSAS